jgi:hypothetical protein
VVQNPDPNLLLTTLTGRTRTLDDWTTMFDLCLVVLPGWPQASRYVPLGRRALDVFRGADCRATFVVTGTETAARKLLGKAAGEFMVFVDPERALVRSLGLERLPAFVHIKADCTVGDVAESWDPQAWNRVSENLGRKMSWSHPVYPLPSDPPPFAGWSIA